MSMKTFILLFISFQLVSSEYRTCEDAISKLKSDYSCVRSDPIGTGSSGRAFVVRNAKENRKEIIKTQDCSSRGYLQAGEYEYRIIKKINHVNVIKSYGFEVSTTEYCFTFLEFGDKGDLSGIVKRNSKAYAEPQLFLRKIKELALGIQALHKANICHADLKLLNVVVDKDDIFKIIDFDNSMPLKTRRTALIGTPYYIDPLLARNSFVYDWFTDIHCLGVMAYELGVGNVVPFKGQSQKQLFLNIVTGKYALPATMDIKVAFVIHGLLRDQPKDRFTVEQLIMVLDTFLTAEWKPEPFGTHTVSSKTSFPVTQTQTIPENILNLKKPVPVNDINNNPQQLQNVNSGQPKNNINKPVLRPAQPNNLQNKAGPRINHNQPNDLKKVPVDNAKAKNKPISNNVEPAKENQVVQKKPEFIRNNQPKQLKGIPQVLPNNPGIVRAKVQLKAPTPSFNGIVKKKVVDPVIKKKPVRLQNMYYPNLQNEKLNVSMGNPKIKDNNPRHIVINGPILSLKDIEEAEAKEDNEEENNFDQNAYPEFNRIVTIETFHQSEPKSGPYKRSDSEEDEEENNEEEQEHEDGNNEEEQEHENGNNEEPQVIDGPLENNAKKEVPKYVNKIEGPRQKIDVNAKIREIEKDMANFKAQPKFKDLYPNILEHAKKPGQPEKFTSELQLRLFRQTQEALVKDETKERNLAQAKSQI